MARLKSLSFALFLLTLLGAPACAQSSVTIQYIHDAAGRLVKAIDSSGTVLQYDYDANGNLVDIKRISGASVTIQDFAPKVGLPGDQVTFTGLGFGAGGTSVSFNGAAAQVVSSNATTVVAVVPQAATTGPVTITTKLGSATTAQPFAVGSIRISPSAGVAMLGSAVQFTASISPASADQSVTWSVDGVVGGNAGVGAITSNGLYTAPNTPGSVIVSAVSAASASLHTESHLTLESIGRAVDVSAADGVVAAAEPDSGVPNAVGGGVALYDARSLSATSAIGLLPAPLPLAHVPQLQPVTRVACGRGWVAAAEGNAGVALLNIHDPANPSVVFQVPTDGSAQAVAVGRSVAFAGTSAGAVDAIDVAAGQVIARLSLPDPVQDLALDGDTLYALTSTSLVAISTAGLGQGQLQILGSVASPTFGGSNQRLFVGGGLACAVQSNGVNTFNVSNPAKPALITGTNSSRSGWRDFALNGSGLGIAIVGSTSGDDSAHGLATYNFTDPSKTNVQLASFALPAQARALTLYNGLALVADDTAGLQVVDYLPVDTKGMAPAVQFALSFDPTKGVMEGAPLRVTALATDDVQVGTVQFLIDGKPAFTDGNFPFEFRFTAPGLAQEPSGSFRLKAVATDTGGLTAATQEITVPILRDTTPLSVLSTTPANNAILATEGAVSATFSKPLDPATLTTAAFQLLPAAGAAPVPAGTVSVPGVLTYSALARTAMLSFPQPLAPGIYQAQLSSDVKDLDGNSLAGGYTWLFYLVGGDQSLLPAGIRTMVTGRPPLTALLQGLSAAKGLNASPIIARPKVTALAPGPVGANGLKISPTIGRPKLTVLVPGPLGANGLKANPTIGRPKVITLPQFMAGGVGGTINIIVGRPPVTTFAPAPGTAPGTAGGAKPGATVVGKPPVTVKEATK